MKNSKVRVHSTSSAIAISRH